MDYNIVEKALQEKYSTNITDVYIPSLKSELSFKSITVGEQKTLTKLMIDADEDDYKLYQIVLGLIQNNCLNDDFNIGELLEIDRIKIILEMYQSNFFQDDVEIECKSCGLVNKVATDFSKLTDVLNNMDLSVLTYEVNDMVFELEYPTIARMADYYKRNSLLEDGDDSQFDIYECFIKTIHIDDIDIDMNAVSFEESSGLISILPQELLYGPDGVIQFIDEKLLNSIESLTEEMICISCGSKLTEDVSIHDFFI